MFQFLSSQFFFRVRNWALKFGVDLWEFGRQFTKISDIKNVSIASSPFLFLVQSVFHFPAFSFWISC